MADRVVITTGDLEHAVRSNAALESAGFETALATSVDEARQAILRREPIPDCLVLTGGLHEPSAAQLLVLARDRSVSTLGLVESTEPDPQGLARRLGLTAFLEKPADPAEVVATVRRLVERRRLQQRTGIIGESPAIQEMLVKIEEMAPATQVKLLRVLEDRTFFRVGGTQPIKVDVRVIAATNKSLKEQVALGRFRDDLFYRLNVLYIYLPPLRERRTDIPLLVRRFIAEFAATHDREFRGITPEALQILVDADWPGNVRQLRNLIESMVVLAPEVVSRPGRTMGDVERATIGAALRETKGNRRKAAEILGIGERTLYRKIKEYALA